MLPYLPTRLRLSKRREGKNAREFLGSLAGVAAAARKGC